MSRDQRSGGPLLGRGTKMIGSLIGAGTEAYAHHKEKKEQAKAQQTRATPDVHDHDVEDENEDEHPDDEDWALDDASENLSAGNQNQHSVSLLDMRGLETPSQPICPLAYPVILPQRRPQTKSRGFVRAYAPVLGECKGIDQATFLKFLDEFYESTQSSKWLQAVNVASNAVGMIPSPIAMAVSTGLNVGVKVGTEVESRYKTNSYLDAINKKLFHPRNLHCLIMTFKPNSSQKVVDIDLNVANTAMTKATSNPTQKPSITSKLKSPSQGVSKSEFAIPEAAPLIYPAIDQAATTVSETGQPLPQSKQNALKRSSNFISEYIDRRAQAEYTGSQGPNSKLSVPSATQQQNFASRYADPNHPANSGGIIALLTGGAMDPRAKRMGKRADRKARIKGQELTEQDRQNVAMGRGMPGRRQPVVKKMLSEDVLYLLIAEIPSQEEMESLGY